MMPLALIAQAHGLSVAGTDRSYDQGRTPEKFSYLKAQGIDLYPQDGSAIQSGNDILVISTAVEDTVPDVVAAKEKGCAIQKRAELLASFFNQSKTRIAVAGTSGKTTVTGMIAHMLCALGADPTVMNGGVMKNFMDETHPYASFLTGQGGVFVTEADESDGSIALYSPTIAVLNNIALDHKPLEELLPLFEDFLNKADHCVLNMDCPNVQKLSGKISPEKIISYSLKEALEGFDLKVPGAHNISNAHAALGVAKALGLEEHKAIEALSDFVGIKRRLDIVGMRNGIIVIDDFAHNPDKISASLNTLNEQRGRLLVFFQPHGYGFLKLVAQDLAKTFSHYMRPEDHLFLVEPFYTGGTVDRSVQIKDIAPLIEGPQVRLLENREEIKKQILDLVQEGDRIVIMGARDDSLSDFAREILEAL